MSRTKVVPPRSTEFLQSEKRREWDATDRAKDATEARCPYKSEAEREAAKKRRGDDCCCCIKAPFQPWHGRDCPHGL